MKSTIKISALILAFAGFSFGAKAQSTTTPAPASTSTTTTKGIILSIGADAGVPTGKFNDNYNWNFGGSVQADIPVANKLFATVNAGYDNFFAKNTVANAADVHLLPVKAGLKYFPISKFYVQGEAGAAFLLNKTDLNDDKSAAFVYAPQIGYQFPLGGKSYLDAGVRYEATGKFKSDIDDSKVNFFGLRVAYAFDTK
jgi:hypothetical protein